MIKILPRFVNKQSAMQLNTERPSGPARGRQLLGALQPVGHGRNSPTKMPRCGVLELLRTGSSRDFVVFTCLLLNIHRIKFKSRKEALDSVYKRIQDECRTAGPKGAESFHIFQVRLGRNEVYSCHRGRARPRRPGWGAILLLDRAAKSKRIVSRTLMTPFLERLPDNTQDTQPGLTHRITLERFTGKYQGVDTDLVRCPRGSPMATTQQIPGRSPQAVHLNLPLGRAE
ncbi:hypothetical protein GGTG_07878 [Gaeumannomyces tritici R3-111a-1]|uniref:Uncharacterized protein n=1 Tax=Gaeumannomyces tritici (strain R3-111a-1) TaxID=644352 RepID=J3P2Y7_GAET3|nr:hypothetical protein GGTG_07878 [Gaeumannomyces tritici R3-111a-1]EJT74029.1 hypothetical protein GGTG_07878 [Gaeumannomyces tritici R3-111a-1]